ncbi:MAG: hypothetical protein LCH56_01345 [Proteobacteria bacterium]|nr:hypothetical protein [Pseudomonadota bacterium]
MSRYLLCGVATAYFLSLNAANAASFRVETHARGYKVFSTYEKPEECEVNLHFTFTRDGKRDKGESLCTFKPVPQGKDVQFCEFSHERLVDPVISEPLKPTCKPLK